MEAKAALLQRQIKPDGEAHDKNVPRDEERDQERFLHGLVGGRAHGFLVDYDVIRLEIECL